MTSPKWVWSPRWVWSLRWEWMMPSVMSQEHLRLVLQHLGWYGEYEWWEAEQWAGLQVNQPFLRMARVRPLSFVVMREGEGPVVC